MHKTAAKAQVVLRQSVAQKAVAVRNRPLKRGVAALLLAVVLALVYVWARISVIQLGYEVTRLHLRVNELDQERVQLQAEIANLLAPERLEQVAEELFQMRRPSGSEIIYVPIIVAPVPLQQQKDEGNAQVSDRR